MQKIPKGIVAIASVIVITAFIFYLNATKIFQRPKGNPMMPPVDQKPVRVTDEEVVTGASGSKEVSATTIYDVPEAEITHSVKFTLVLDAEGKVVEVRMVEMPKEEASDKQKAFAAGLTAMIKGKKLSEITKVDKVGKSTITTDAFNAVVDDLKAKL